MKNALLTLVQFLLFYGLFFAGSLLGAFDPMHLRWFVHAGSPGGPPAGFFVPDGLILMVLVFALILLIEAVRRRIPQAGPWTFLAFALALILGFLSKFGFVHPS